MIRYVTPIVIQLPKELFTTFCINLKYHTAWLEVVAAVVVEVVSSVIPAASFNKFVIYFIFQPHTFQWRIRDFENRGGVHKRIFAENSMEVKKFGLFIACTCLANFRTFVEAYSKYPCDLQR